MDIVSDCKSVIKQVPIRTVNMKPCKKLLIGQIIVRSLVRARTDKTVNCQTIWLPQQSDGM